jgi:filamentous hemagglutinin family protein
MKTDFLHFLLSGNLFLGYLFTNISAQAQVSSDKTLPVLTRVEQSGSTFEISGGTESGNNLFHSFDVFSPKENTVRFLNDNVSIKNVISRITGTSASEILGRIESGGVEQKFNLFLINPNGIIFGSQTSLDINGSFVATTANSIRFGNKGFFDASRPNDPSILTIDPTAFFFNQIRIQPIAVYQSVIEVPSDKSLVLLGGNVEIDGGTLNAPNGRVELGSIAEPGSTTLNINKDTFNLDFPVDVERGNISLSNNALVNVVDKGSGSISVNARNIELTGTSALFAGIGSELMADANKPGDIVLNATQTVTFKGIDSGLANIAFSAIGSTGNISITADSLTMESLSGVVTYVSGKGNSGDITLNIRNEVVISGSNEDSGTLIGSTVARNGQGNSGNIMIQAGSFSLSDGAAIRSNILGRGDSGNISIHADDFVSIKDGGNTFSSLILTAVEPGAVGNGGNIDITARALSLTDGGQLSAAVLGPDFSRNLPGGQGRGGNISVNATDSVIVSGLGLEGFTSGIFADSEAGGNGSAGNVSIATNFLQISDGAQVKLSNPQGQAGNLRIKANSMVLNNGKVTAETGGSRSSNSANINLTVSELLKIENESLISAKASGSANSGNIKIDAPILLALPPTGSNGSDIIANAVSGTGGNIAINAQGIFGIEELTAFDGNQSNDIDASSQFGRSGQVQLMAEADPSKDIVELPSTVVDPSALVAQSPCRRGSRSEFTRSGKGGLPPSIGQDFNSDATQVALVTPASTSLDKQQTKPLTRAVESTTSALGSESPVVPAQGWVFNNKGEVVLVADNAVVVGPQRLKTNPAGCPLP